MELTEHPITQKQLTIRAIIAGAIIGGVMSLSNLYVVLKTGWSIGVALTAGILAFAIFSVLLKLKIVKEHFGILENNAMQSVASAAGYMTGGGTVAAIPALMMITGESMPPLKMFIWITFIAMLGVVMAIPMKQQMINIEKLAFPSGIAAAETLKALHGDGKDGIEKARYLAYGGFFGVIVAALRDIKTSFMPFNLPEMITLPVKLKGLLLSEYTLAIEGSVIMLGSGAIMGFRSAWSLILGVFINYVILAPWLYETGVLKLNDKGHLGYKAIVSWSVWFGAGMLLTSGLLSFALQWRTVVRAIRGLGGSSSSKELDSHGHREVPMNWFYIGVIVLAPIVIFCEWFFFGINIFLGVLSIVLSFFLSLVACRATGETDTTPNSALGKMTQVTTGIFDPGNITSNLMTANVTAGVAAHSADLLTDLKSGYLLNADPRQQFIAQFFGVLAGSFFVVPAYAILIPSPEHIGTSQWPAPAAQTWKGVAELMARGFNTLHPTAQTALFVGAFLGITLVLIEYFLPKNYKKWIPSATGVGLAFTAPAHNSIAMFMGAAIALVLEKVRPVIAEKTIVPVSSGFIAGESLTGVFVAALVVFGVL